MEAKCKCCKDCTDRHLGCHAECEKYKEFKEETARLKKDEIEMRRHLYGDFVNYHRDEYAKRCKRNAYRKK